MSPIVLLVVAALAVQSPRPDDSCRLIEPTQAQQDAEFSNAVALGPFAMRTIAGSSACDFPRPGEGHCTLTAPQLVHITLDDRHAWYEIDSGRDVRVEVSGGVATCRVLGAERPD